MGLGSGAACGTHQGKEEMRLGVLSTGWGRAGQDRAGHVVVVLVKQKRVKGIRAVGQSGMEGPGQWKSLQIRGRFVGFKL